jgi:hypothetical protein
VISETREKNPRGIGEEEKPLHATLTCVRLERPDELAPDPGAAPGVFDRNRAEQARGAVALESGHADPLVPVPGNPEITERAAREVGGGEMGRGQKSQDPAFISALDGLNRETHFGTREMNVSRLARERPMGS